MKQIIVIKKNHEFRRMYSKGTSAACATLVIYLRKNPKGISRLGITTGTKVGHAVVRNRVRRRIREIYRADKQNLVPGYDMIVIARSRAGLARYDRLQTDFVQLTKKLKIRRPADG